MSPIAASPPIFVRIHGPAALFSSPAFKTERVTYEIITPGAARGVLEAVLWKPAFRWRIHRIHVCAPIQFARIMRNEVGSKASLNTNAGAYFADEDRVQRNSLYLTNVDYVVEASIVMTERAGPGDSLRKFEEMFQRRLEKGQTFSPPFLGCREFHAIVEPPVPGWRVAEELACLPEKPLGQMLLDIRHNPAGNRMVDDRVVHHCRDCRPLFFEAVLKHGVLEVPDPETWP